MNRDRVMWIFGAVGVLLLALAGWWLSTHTEWEERPIWRHATGEARTNPVYASEQLLRQLGMTAEHRDTMNVLPPQHGRLVILSDDWAAVPGQAERLQAWVKQGGHLVLMSGTAWRSTPLADWVPVNVRMVNEGDHQPGGKDAPAPSNKALDEHQDTASASADDEASEDADDDADAHADSCDDCENDSDTSQPSYDCKNDATADTASDGKASPGAVTPITGSTHAPLGLEVPPSLTPWKQCGLFQPNLRLTNTSGIVHEDWTWSIFDGGGTQALRVEVGQGTVTVLNSIPNAFMQTTILDCDHAPMLTAALQAEAGATVWFYLSEKRQALLPWLWQEGWIAVVLGSLTLAAALWRRAVRFGPALPTPPRLRRSIGEQVRGMGHYLMRHGSEALLHAQQRALEATAARRLVDYSRHPLPDRARRIAQATGVSEHDLHAALSARFCTRVELPARLQILELARRRLQTHSHERPSR
jgi:hypothetical protein